jgi:hypothetical protein
VNRLSLLPALLLLAAAVSSTIVRAKVDRGEIEPLLRSIETAAGARDLPGVLAAYDPADPALLDRARNVAQGWLAHDELHLTYRLGALTGDSDKAEAIVFRSVRYTEHGRAQVDHGWQTVRLRRTASGWRIVSEEDRVYALCAGTDLRVEILPEEGRMRGTATLRIEVIAAGEDSLLLRLNRGLEVKSVTAGVGGPLRFEREADAIVVPQAQELRKGDAPSLVIAFEGTLFNESKEDGYSQVSIAPGGSFASWVTSWYPRLQGIAAKSKGRITYVVPPGITVVSTGRFEGSRVEGQREQVFTIDEPLDFSFAAAKYYAREAIVDGTRLGVYLLRGGDAKADLYIQECVRTLRYQRELYGRYPYEGYAVVEIPSEETGTLGGSSEQGMNLFPAGVLPDDAFPLLLVAHEMAHGWWGNLIRSGDGAITDEGLAQITAVLCLREFQGEAAMRRFLKVGGPGYSQSAAQYFVRFAGPKGRDYPLGGTAAGSDAAIALHDIADTKGMFVYDMLRQRIGQEAFVRGLRKIVGGFAGRSVTLSDLRAAWEKASGTELRAFFQQWFSRTGAPDLVLQATTEAAGPGFVTSGTIAQTGDSYDVVVEIALASPGHRETKTVAVSGASTPFSFRTETKPDWVVLDPEYKILRWTPGFRNYPLLKDGRELASKGRNEEAIAKLEEFVARAPESLEGRYRLGVACEETGKLERAEPCFRFVLDRYASLGVYEPAVSLSQLHLGHVLDRTGRRDEAKEAYRNALALPDESGSHKDAESRLAATTAGTRTRP